MKLFALVLRSATSGSGPGSSVPSGLFEPRFWSFRDLVVRRGGYALWGVSHAAPAGGAAVTLRDPSAEPPWVDTQPWCHK
jgi:hypothetical protein